MMMQRHSEPQRRPPQGYTKVEYLEVKTSDAAQAILLGRYSTTDIKSITMKGRIGERDGRYRTLFGLYQSDSYRSWRVVTSNSATSKSLGCYADSMGGDSAYWGGNVGSEPFELYMKKGMVILNGIEHITEDSSYPAINRDLKLFGPSQTTTITGILEGARIYSGFIVEGFNGNLHDLDACIRDSDGQVGYWDYVSETFKAGNKDYLQAGPEV